MASKHVCVSFDYENDRRYYNLLEAWNKNPDIPFHISDCTPNEIQSESIQTIKQVLSSKIGEVHYMIAIIGEHSRDRNTNYVAIGHRNWQAYEIAKNTEKGNKLIVVKINSSYNASDEAYGVGAE